MFKRQTFRLYPNKEQELVLKQWSGQARFVWNNMLTLNQKTYEETKKFVFGYDMSNKLPELKKEFEWLKECPSQVLQQKCQDLGTALSFKKNGRGFPKFKSKHRDTSGIRFPQGIKIEGNRIKLPKLKSGIKIKLHQAFHGKRSACTIYKNRADQWFASFVVEIADVTTNTVDLTNVVGIDVGLKDFAITSDGEIVKNPKFLRKSEKKLKAAQRKLSRKKSGSNNRNKARLKVARIHNKIKNQRKDFINQVSSSIAKNYDLVVMENINVVGLMKNHCMAKSIADASWSMFTDSVRWQCLKRGKQFHQVGMFFPSSKTCSSCGEKKTDLSLGDRIFKCDSCGFEIDRDINAALNLKDQGIKEYNTVGTTEINA